MGGREGRARELTPGHPGRAAGQEEVGLPPGGRRRQLSLPEAPRRR